MAAAPIQPALAPASENANLWYDEIDGLLDGYQRALLAALEPGQNELSANVRHYCVMSYVRDLAAHGVTVSGGIGHA